jgi:hypothetical protein
LGVEGQYFGNRIEQCGGSWMFIPDTGSRFLPIPAPGSKNRNKIPEEKNLLQFF